MIVNHEVNVALFPSPDDSSVYPNLGDASTDSWVHPNVGETTKLRRGAVRGGVILMISRLAIQAISWFVTIEVARILRPYDYGILTSGMILVGLGDLLVESGLGKALVQQQDVTADDVAEAFTLLFWLSLILYAILWAMARPTARFFQCPEVVVLLRVTGTMLLLVPFRAVPAALLERNLLLGRQSAIFVFSSLVQSGVAFSLANMGFGYWALAATIVVGRLLETLTLAPCAHWIPRFRRPGAAVWKMMTFGIHVLFSGLAWFVFSQSDYAVVSWIAGPIALGYYSFAFQIISIPVSKLATTFNQVSYPVFCRLQNDPVKLRDWYLRLMTLLGALGMPLFAGMALVAEDGVVVLLGEKWRPAVLPLRLLCFAGVIMFFNCTLHPILYARGRPDIPAKYNIGCAILMPASFALLGARFGLPGICAAWIVIYPLITAALVMLSRQITGISLMDLVRGQAAAAAAIAVMAVVVAGTQQCLPADREVAGRLTLSIATGAIAYGGSLLVLGKHAVIRDSGLLLRELRGIS